MFDLDTISSGANAAINALFKNGVLDPNQPQPGPGGPGGPGGPQAPPPQPPPSGGGDDVLTPQEKAQLAKMYSTISAADKQSAAGDAAMKAAGVGDLSSLPGPQLGPQNGALSLPPYMGLGGIGNMPSPEAANLNDPWHPILPPRSRATRVAQAMTGQPDNLDLLQKIYTPEQLAQILPHGLGGIWDAFWGGGHLGMEKRINADLAQRGVMQNEITTQNQLNQFEASKRAFPYNPNFTPEQMGQWTMNMLAANMGYKPVEETLGPLADRIANRELAKQMNGQWFVRLGQDGQPQYQSFSRQPGQGPPQGQGWSPYEIGGKGSPVMWHLPDGRYLPFAAGTYPKDAQGNYLQGALPSVDFRQETGINNTDFLHNDSQAFQRAGKFWTSNENALFTKQANKYINAKTILNEAAQGNAAGLSPSILNFAGMVDSDAQLRQGTITYIKTIDKSWSGSVAQWFAEKIKGLPNPQMIREMNSVLDAMHEQQVQAAEERYAGELAQNPMEGRYLTAPSVMMPEPQGLLIDQDPRFMSPSRALRNLQKQAAASQGLPQP